MLDINKQLMKYSQHGQKVTIYEKDDDGNIKYYVDGDGNKIPLIADEKVGFSEPKEFYANISNKLSEVLVKEFGVDDSITGLHNPHPNASVSGWKYDVNEHGESGWFYYRDGEWHWTKGMPSRPFMYETDLELILEISKIAKEVFGNG